LAILIVIVVISVIGIGFVIWTMNKDDGMSVEALHPQDIHSLNPSSFEHKKVNKKLRPGEAPEPIAPSPKPLANLIESIRVLRKKAPDLQPLEAPTPGIESEIRPVLSSLDIADDSSFGTAALKTQPQPIQPMSSLSDTEVKKIEAEIDFMTQLNEWKEKAERLEKILKDKNTEFETVQESLNNELKHRKEFNKIKDLLEKELKDAKDNARDYQAQMNLSRTEAEGAHKRINQLEEKATKLEKDILKKEDEIDNLLKRLQTFASPQTAATPPKKELPAQDIPIVELSPPSVEISSEIKTENAQPVSDHIPSLEETAQVLSTDMKVVEEEIQIASPILPDPVIAPQLALTDTPIEPAAEENSNEKDEKIFLKLKPDIASEETNKPEPS
jgi:hypothetical protein